MSETTVNLQQPVTFGDTAYDTVVLREVTAGDVIEAQEESEKLVYTADGPALLSSASRVGLNVLRRQIARLCQSSNPGSYDGPLSYDELKRFDIKDLNHLQRAAEELEGAVDAELVQQQAEQRGRDEGVDTAD